MMGITTEELLNRADKAMYYSKQTMDEIVFHFILTSLNIDRIVFYY